MLAVRLQHNRWELTALSSNLLKPQVIFYQTSCIMQPKCQWWLICGSSGRNSLNTTPPTEGTYSQRGSMTASYFSSNHFYHSQGPDTVESSNHVLHRRQPDFRLQHTSSLSSLLFVSILSNATPAWPKGKRSIVISSSHLQSFDWRRQISHSIWMTVWL